MYLRTTLSAAIAHNNNNSNNKHNKHSSSVDYYSEPRTARRPTVTSCAIDRFRQNCGGIAAGLNFLAVGIHSKL